MADYRVQADVFGRLKGALLPLGRPGEEERCAAALKVADLALQRLDMATVLDDRVRSLIGILDDAIDRPRGKKRLDSAAWALRAGKMSAAGRRTFAEAVDDLADWFARQPRPATASELVVGYLRSIAGDIAWDVFKKL